MHEKFSTLEWIRIFDPTHIPRQLVEQIKERDFSVDRFYEYQKSVCVDTSSAEVVINPFNFLYLVTDENRSPVGFLWAVADILNGYLIINNYSMDRKYWCKGQAIEFVSKHIQNILDQSKLKKVFWCTKHTKDMETHGFKKSKSQLMEYIGVDDGAEFTGDTCTTDRGSEPSDGGTGGLSESVPSAGTRSGSGGSGGTATAV